MRNKIEKTNKTKFDYKARILGVVGIAIFALTVIIGGNTLLTISNESVTSYVTNESEIIDELK